LKITKLVHSCILVETTDSVALFDPGSMSIDAVHSHPFDRLDNIFITHEHGDHLDTNLIKHLVNQFPEVHIIAPQSVVDQLGEENIVAAIAPPAGVSLFDAPHETVEPLFPTPAEIGIHYFDSFSHPGDSHSFTETKPVLALPITAPWGATVTAVKLALKLKPKHVIPIHDWHWNDVARQQMYNSLEQLFANEKITFHKMVTGQPVEIEL
jgi:L-ascorbate metabolism protein UlaG (beta-lactamase superfamily)